MNKVGLIKFIEFLSGLIFLAVLWKYGFNGYGFKMATIAMMISLSALVFCARILSVPLTKMQFMAWVLTMTLGSLTVIFDNPIYYKLKTTFLYLGISLVFLVSHFWGEKTVLERLTGDKIPAPKELMRKVSLWTIFYLTSVAFLNYYVASYYSTDIWTYFKYGALLGFNFLFIIFIIFKLKDYLKDFLEENSNSFK